MRNLRVWPLDFVAATGVVYPSDPRLHEAAQAFCREQFGEAAPNLAKLSKVWIVGEADDAGQLAKVVALGGWVYRVDVPVFHVAKPESAKNTEEWKEVFRARDLLMGRMRAYLEDNGARGTEVFVFVDPAERERWSGYLKRIGARESNRVLLEI